MPNSIDVAEFLDTARQLHAAMAERPDSVLPYVQHNLAQLAVAQRQADFMALNAIMSVAFVLPGELTATQDDDGTLHVFKAGHEIASYRGRAETDEGRSLFTVSQLQITKIGAAVMELNCGDGLHAAEAAETLTAAGFDVSDLRKFNAQEAN